VRYAERGFNLEIDLPRFYKKLYIFNGYGYSLGARIILAIIRFYLWNRLLRLFVTDRLKTAPGSI